MDIRAIRVLLDFKLFPLKCASCEATKAIARQLVFMFNDSGKNKAAHPHTVRLGHPEPIRDKPCQPSRTLAPVQNPCTSARAPGLSKYRSQPAPIHLEPSLFYVEQSIPTLSNHHRTPSNARIALSNDRRVLSNRHRVLNYQGYY